MITESYTPIDYKADFSDILSPLSLVHKQYLQDNFYGLTAFIDNTQIVGIVGGIENVDGTTYNIYHQFVDYKDIIVGVVNDSDGRDIIVSDIQRLSDRVVVTFSTVVQDQGTDYRVLVLPIKTPTALNPSVQTPTKTVYDIVPGGTSSTGVTEIVLGQVYDIDHTISSDVFIQTMNVDGEKVTCSEAIISPTKVRIEFGFVITTDHKVMLI